MVDAIKRFFVEFVGAKGAVFFCSMIPIIELRGSVILGAALKVSWWQNYLLSVIGNLLPIVFILLLLNWFLEKMKNIKGLSKIALWLENKAEKNRPKIEKYGFWGLTLFVMIPLPGTGAWTGALVACMMKMRFWKAFLAITIGVVLAGVIMTLASYGVLSFLSFLL